MPDELLTPTSQVVDPSAYLTRLAGATLTLALREANLPAASTEAIEAQFAGKVPTTDQIDAAIAAQRALISQLSFSITGHDHPLDGGRVSGMRTNLDEAQGIVNWMFGVPEAKLPPPSLRSPAAIYGALSGDYEWRGVYQPQHVLFASATTTTLADLAANAMNKIVTITWSNLSEYRWFEPLVTVQPHDGSTHDMPWIEFGGISNLPVVSQGQAYTELSVADGKESDAFVKYGGYVGITEEMLRKSELARIQAVPKALAIAAVRTRSAALASIFTQASGTGPTLDNDSTVLFHANHGGNVQTTAFTKAAWGAARLECYKMTEMGSSKRLGFWPKFFIGPADLYDTALEVFNYGAGPGGYYGTNAAAAAPNVNPYGESRPGDPRPVIVAVPDFTDVTDWAYLADPNQLPVLQMSYAQAPGGGTHPAPEIYSVTSPTAGLMFSNDVLPVKVRDWFAYGVSTWRGIGKRNVAG